MSVHILKLTGQGRPWPDPTGLGQGPARSGLALRARVKGQEKWVGPGPARPLDSVDAAVVVMMTVGQC